jgi:hypothetical protein
MTIVVTDSTGSGSGPTHYSIEGDELLVYPTPDDSLSLDCTYYAKLPALAENSTNWLLTKYPQIYLYATLVSASQFLKDNAGADYWGNLYAQAVAVAKASDVRAMSSGSPLRIRPR